MTEEVWKPITDYGHLYEVSNLGRVRSLDRQVWNKRYGTCRTVNGQIKKLHVQKNGQTDVSLTKNGKGKFFLVNRLVALHFLHNPNNYPFVTHINEVGDNRAVNLRWGTEMDSQSKHRKKVLCVETGIMYNSIKEAADKLGFDNSLIGKACRGAQSKAKRMYSNLAYGYHWEYAI